LDSLEEVVVEVELDVDVDVDVAVVAGMVVPGVAEAAARPTIPRRERRRILTSLERQAERIGVTPGKMVLQI
jgi:hypothetical protein